MFKKFIDGKKVVCFDLDGTLVDSQPVWDTVFRDSCNSLGLTWPGIANFAGWNLSEVWDYLKERSSFSIKLTSEELAMQSRNKFVQMIPNVDIDVLEGFWSLAMDLKDNKRMRLALATNSPKSITNAILARLGIVKTFDLILCEDDVKKPKPNPEIYKTLAQKMQVQPKDVLVFEDSPVGVQAALKAGMAVIVVWDGTVDEFAYPQGTLAYISDFSDLVGQLDQTFDDVLHEAADAAQASQQEKKDVSG